MSSSVRTRDGSFSVAASIQAQDSSKSKRELIDFPAVLEWAKRNSVKVRRSERALEAVNSVHALNGLPRFVLKTSEPRTRLPTNKRRRPTAPVAPSPIAKTEDGLLDLVASHSGMRIGLVTPQIATWLLTLNTGNRKVIPDNVNRFKRVLQENRWLGREMAGVLAYADDRGRDAFAFQPIKSRYLEVADDLRVRTPYSKTIVKELPSVPWAWWDGELKAWQVPFRSWEELRKRWPAIEAAALRNEPGER